MRGLGLSLALFFTYSCQSLVFNQYFNVISTVQVQLHGSLVSAVFDKSCRLSTESRGSYTSGQIQNLMSTDSRTVADVVLYIHMLWSSLEQILVAMILLVNLMGGIPTMAGVLFILATMPVQAMLVAAIKSLREQASSRTDERVKSVAEGISGIKLIKLYAWEFSFVTRILEARARELEYLRKMALTQAWSTSIVLSLPVMLTVVAFVTYAATGRALNAAVVFPAIALFNVVRPSMIFFPNTIISSARAAASLNRLERFLTTEELTPINEGPHALDQGQLEASKTDLAAEKVSFTWDPSISRSHPTLSAVSFQIPEGSLVAIVGPTGAGKSSLLAGLLGEIPITAGKVGIRKSRSICFCDQIPFIQNATVRDNILFGKGYDEKHYITTVQVCNLVSDFKLLPAGDLTEIGGRGVNLSGGQRARVSLARAVYSRAAICLLDDPLSAVDAHVGNSIFNDCIVSMLRGKTRLLTTNQIHFAASPDVDFVITVNNGTVLEFGRRHDLLANSDSEFSRLLKAAGEIGAGQVSKLVQENGDVETGKGIQAGEESIQRDFSASENMDITDSHDHAQKAASEKRTERASLLESYGIANYGALESGMLIRKERKEKGRVEVRHFGTYFKAMGIFQWVLPIFLFALSSHVCNLAVNLWLSRWSEESAAANRPDRSVFNLVVFCTLGFLAVVVASGSSFAVAYGSIRASVLLHERLLLSVFGAPSSFFNTTPEGRLVNRFNADLDKIDSTLSSALLSLLRLVLGLMFTLGLILWATPAFIFIVIPVGAVCLYVQEFYRKSSVDIRRLEALARSPLYSHFGETLDGVMTIRAYGDVPRATYVNDVCTDRLNKTTYASTSANRWVAVRLESLGTVLIFGATILAMFAPPGKLSASVTGLALSYVMQILGAMTWSVRQFTESESQMSAMERISEYSEPPFAQEEEGGLEGFLKEQQNSSRGVMSVTSKGLVSKEKLKQLSHGLRQHRSRWPKKGEVVFENVEMRYRKDLPPALKSVSFAIAPGEHVGIVGRTGAGKSSAIQCLFRLFELEKGRIIIDGVDISKLRLFNLRSSLGIIPQEPICFSGTIRSNLDMFNEHDEASVQNALRLCGLQETMESKVDLNYEISENGSNLSVGQRQLLCLGRALLRDSQILVLDEATSSVSNETDQKIQRTLRGEMGHCTVLTVAHRLHTVMQSDRIIVMHAGRIAEMGTPDELLNRPSMLSDLVDETGPITAAHLRHLATLPRGSKNGNRNESKRQSGEKKGERHEAFVCQNSRNQARKRESLLTRVRHAFLEMRNALVGASSAEMQNELTVENISAKEWQEQLQIMVSKLNVLSENMVTADMHNMNGSLESCKYIADVSTRTSDMIGGEAQDASPRAVMPLRAKRDSDEDLRRR